VSKFQHWLAFAVLPVSKKHFDCPTIRVTGLYMIELNEDLEDGAYAQMLTQYCMLDPRIVQKRQSLDNMVGDPLELGNDEIKH
jgi:hypothetical protein